MAEMILRSDARHDGKGTRNPIARFDQIELFE